MANSEKDIKCWFIENPVTKDLVKSITVRLGSKAEQEFIIVLKAPQNRMSYNMASFVTIRQPKLGGRGRSSTDEETAPVVEKQLSKTSSGDVDLKEKRIETELKVLILGKLSNPKIKCLKELWHEESQSMVVPLAVKKSMAQQKFRIPFKNLSQNLDSEFEFTFVKIPKSQMGGETEDTVKESAVDILDSLEFYCQPSLMKINSGQQGVLNVLIKCDTAKLQ